MKSQAQRDSQIKAMEAARGAAARRAEAKRRAEREAADRQHEFDNHIHRWTNWEYSEDYTTETKRCKVYGCEESETRKIRI